MKKEMNDMLLLLGYLTEKEMRGFRDQKWGQRAVEIIENIYYLTQSIWKWGVGWNLLMDYVHLPVMSKAFIAIWENSEIWEYLIKMSVKTAEWSKCTW